MKLMHIADLHIGKVYRDISFLDDQKEILKQIVDMAIKEKIDALLIAGDIYQKVNPSSNDMEVVNQFLTNLANNKIKTYIIAGNHDSLKRVSYLSSLIKNEGIYIADDFNGKIEKYQLTDEYGIVNISLLPFFKVSQIKEIYGDDQLKTIQACWEVIQKNNSVNSNERNVLLMHQFISGATTCDSEELNIGGLDMIEANTIKDYDYVALGHLHGPQRVTKDTIRYSGSIMKYSFSEIHHTKSATIIELKEKGNITISTLPFTIHHDFKELKGKLADILNQPLSDDYVSITLTDEQVPPDAKLSIYMVYPNCMQVLIDNPTTQKEFSYNDLNSDREMKDPISLFQEFYRIQNSGADASDKQVKVIADILDQIKEGEN